MQVIAETYSAGIPNATMKMEKNLRMMTRTRKLMRELKKKTPMLESSSKARRSELWLNESLADYGNQQVCSCL